MSKSLAPTPHRPQKTQKFDKSFTRGSAKSIAGALVLKSLFCYPRERTVYVALFSFRRVKYIVEGCHAQNREGKDSLAGIWLKNVMLQREREKTRRKNNERKQWQASPSFPNLTARRKSSIKMRCFNWAKKITA